MTEPEPTRLSSEELALESKLQTMTPFDLSTRAQHAIASRLDGRQKDYRHLRWAAAIAAGLLIVITPLVLQNQRVGRPAARPTRATDASTLPAGLTNDEEQFAVAAYSNALAQSPASLDAILERQSLEERPDIVNESRVPRIGDVSIVTP